MRTAILVVMWVLLVIAVFMLCVWIPIIIRKNTETHKYSIRLIDAVYDHEDWQELAKIMRTVSYDKIFWSFKPYRLESFYSAYPEFIEKVREIDPSL